MPTIGAIAAHVSGLGFPLGADHLRRRLEGRHRPLVEDLGLVNVRVLRAPQNEGKGSACGAACWPRGGKYVLFDDADNSTPIEEVSKVLAKLAKKGYDVAVGSRAAAGAKSPARAFAPYHERWPAVDRGQCLPHRRAGHPVRLQDVYPPAAQRLYRAQTITGFSFDLEILYLANKFGYKIAEVPVAWVDAPGSKVDPTKEARGSSRSAKIKMNDLRGVYANA